MHDPFEPNTAGAKDPSSELPPLPDLPPVEAPSAGFVVQLFVIPAVVVAVVIFVWLLFGKLAGGERDPAEYVRRLRSGSGDWRSAFELASLIQNDAALAEDPRLLGELTDLLSSELQDKAADSQLTVYLIKTIGNFRTLDATLPDGRQVDPIETLTRALEPSKESAVRMEAAASLARQAARLEGSLENPQAVTALAQTSAAEEPELRQVATYALGFFSGKPAVEALRERIGSDADRYVRYNAAVALGRRGDAAARSTLKEMLTTSDLDRVLEVTSPSEKESKIESIELEALEAVAASASRGSKELASSLRDEVESLTRSGLISVRSKAQSTLQKLQSGP